MNKLHNPVFLLPNGQRWTGFVHQDIDKNWKTGGTPSVRSLPLVVADETWNMPSESHVASQKIFKQVFDSAAFHATLDEDNLKTFNTKLNTLNALVKSSEDLLDIHINRTKKYLNSKSIQEENHGRGVLSDLNLEITLPELGAQSKAEGIESVVYSHNEATPYFIWPGNVEIGILESDHEDKNYLDRAIMARIYVDMVSRTGALLDDIPEETPTVGTTYEFGFNGIIKITFANKEKISSLRIPSNYDIESFTLNKGMEDETVVLMANTESFTPMAVKTIDFTVNQVEPLPFSSYFSNDLQEDFLGEGFVSTGVIKDIYQRTRLELGPINPYLKSYSGTHEEILGPYYCEAGSLASLSFTANEFVDGNELASTSFKYYLLVHNKEYEIVPSNRKADGITLYKINTGLDLSITELQQFSNTGFIDTDTPIVSWELKVKISKPEDSLTSPILHGVKFSYLTSLSGEINV